MADKLQVLDESRTDWSITVRVTRMWPSFNDIGHFYGFNFILLDDQNYHIHAFVHPPNWNAFNNVIFEGYVYQISNFDVTQANGLLRPVSSPQFITFTNMTITRTVQNDVIPQIPMHKFEVVELSDLADIAICNRPDQLPSHAIDIVGVVQNLCVTRLINTHYGEKESVRFQIYDGRTSVNVVFWDEDIEVVNGLTLGHFESPPVVLLSTMHANMFRGSLQVIGLSSSRVFINIDYEAVWLIRQRLLS